MSDDPYYIRTDELDWQERMVHAIRDRAMMDAQPFEFRIPWFDDNDPAHHAGLDQAKESLRQLYQSIGGDDLIFTLRPYEDEGRRGFALDVTPFDLPPEDEPLESNRPPAWAIGVALAGAILVASWAIALLVAWTIR